MINIITRGTKAIYSRFTKLYNNDLLQHLMDNGDTQSILQLLNDNTKPKYYDTVLKWAVREGHVEIVDALIKNGLKITYDNKAGLIDSVKNNHLEMVVALLKSGVDIGILNYSLVLSAKQGYIEIVTVLLEHGANPCVLNNEPLFKSVQNGHLEVVTVLLEYGATCNVDASEQVDRILWHAYMFDHHEIVAKLLEHGGNMRANKSIILNTLQDKFNERMADVILPYCNAEEYHYFPTWYIRGSVVPTKSAKMCARACACVCACAHVRMCIKS